MMKKYSLLLAGGALLMLLAGCNTSVMTVYPPYEGQKSESGREIAANLEASNWGLYLFYYIPIWSGNHNRPNRHDYKTFANQIQNKYMDLMLRNRAELLKADAEDVRITESSSGFFSLWILWRRDHRGTAVAVKRSKSDDAPKKGLFSSKD